MSRSPDPPFADLLREIPDPLAETPGPPPPVRLPALAPSTERPVVRQRRLMALVGSVLWIGVHLVVFGVRTDLMQLPLPYVVAQTVVPFAIAALCLALAFQRGRLGLGAKVGLVSTMAIVGPLSFVLIAVGAPVPTGVPAGDASFLGVLVCFDITVAWAAVPLLFAALTLRGAFAAGSHWRSALVGAAGGLFAGATMNLHCPNLAPSHMLFGHGLPVVLAALAGASLLALRARP